MGISWGNAVPWLDNWPISRQLWSDPLKLPGTELDLTLPNRNLVVQWRDRTTNNVVLAFAEGDSAIRVENPKRGVVTVRLTGNDWQFIKRETVYTVEVIAYGYLYSSSEFKADDWITSSSIPLVGGNVYASPRQALVLVMVAGASDAISEDLSGAWAINPQGYWTRTVFTQVNGLWVNDKNYREVPYEELGTSGDRCFSVVNETIYVKSVESPASAYVETAYNFLTHQTLKRAAAEVERKTGRCFAKQLNIREIQKGLRFQQQVFTKEYPVTLNEFFRLDIMARNRQIYRRYTESNFASSSDFVETSNLSLNPKTGAIALASNGLDIWDWGSTGVDGAVSANFIPKGENNVEITYVSGYDEIPDQLQQACANFAAMQLGRFWKQQLSQGFDSLSIGCVNVNFTQLFTQFFQEWASEADAILGNYQRIDIDAI
jgi:hypothetical protein